MGLANDTTRVKYIADGTRTGFEFAFKIFSRGDVEVYVDNMLKQGGYAVIYDEDENGGSVEFFAAPAEGRIITILRRLDFTRASGFQTGGLLRAEDLNREFDYQRACSKQLNDTVSIAVKVCEGGAPVSTMLPPPAPGRALVWNSDGTALSNQDIDISEQVAFVEDCADVVEHVYNELTSMLGENPTASLVGMVNNIISVLQEKFPDIYFGNDT